MSAHTPGPWLISEIAGIKSLYSKNRDFVFVLGKGGKRKRQKEDVLEANARLIAAAPEMFELLKYFHRNFLVKGDEHEKVEKLIQKIEGGTD